MSKKLYYYYATSIGETPLKTQNKWFDCISDAEELLIKKITRSETMLPLSNSPNAIQEPAKKKRGGSGHQRHQHLRIDLYLVLLLAFLPHHMTIIALLPPPLSITSTLQKQTISLQQRMMKPLANQSMHRLPC